MQSVRPETAKIASVSAVTVVVGYSAILLFNGAASSTILVSATEVGTLLTALGLYWNFFNKAGWKYKIFNLGGWLCSTPDLNGRWEGTICRHRDDQPHRFVMEITQTTVIPHITLLMGEVGCERHYQSLTAAVRSFAHHRRPFSYTLGKPYLRRPSRHFIFVDAQPQNAFRALRLAMYKKLSDFIECEFHGRPDNTSHVTVGYSEEIYPNLSALELVPLPAPAIIKVMQLCVAGKRGTCTEVLELIEMAGRHQSSTDIIPVF